MELIVLVVMLIAVFCILEEAREYFRTRKGTAHVVALPEHRGKVYYTCTKHSSVCNTAPRCYLCEAGSPSTQHKPNKG
jgi:hypothetical protein